MLCSCPLKILVSCCFCVCDNLVFAIELNILTCNIFKNVLFQNLSFHSFKKMKAHNMLSVMLDPKFKSFHSIFLFIGHEQNAINV
jgi:hypothetical protein